MSEPRIGISGEAASTDAFLYTACEARIAAITPNPPARRNAPLAVLLDVAAESEAPARKIANGPPTTMRPAKMSMYRGMEVDLETAMHIASAAEPATFSSRDRLEDLAALREKRVPEFRGV